MWILAYVDTPPTVDKILCMDKFLSIYSLIHGQICPAWMVDSKKMYHGTKLPSFTWTPSCYFSGCCGSFNEQGLRWPKFIHKEVKDQREKCELHISRRICDNKMNVRKHLKSGKVYMYCVNN